MKYNINKILTASLLSGMLLFSTACSDDFLQLSNPNQVSSDTYWKTEDDAIMALTACYDALQSDHLYDDYIDAGGAGFLMRETATDNGHHTWGAWMNYSPIAQGTTATTDGAILQYWKANYELIKRCNLLISNVERIAMSPEKIAEFKAEAMALRALGYCNLISVFRDVPYLTEPLTLDKAEAAKTSKSDIANALLEDLKTNIPSIPSKGTASKGRLTREAAYAIMGRIALFNQHWEKAIEAYQHVIGKYSLFKSGDGSDYEANFRNLFTHANEECDEVLLSVHFLSNTGLGEGNQFSICWGGPMNAIEASMNLADEFYCLDGKPFDRNKPYDANNPDLSRFENRDPRLHATLILPGSTWYNKYYDYVSNKLPAKSSVCIKKWFFEDYQSLEYDGGMDFYIIRYAEVLLSLAEAMNEKGGYAQTDITNFVNEVRKRVGMPTVEEVEGTNLSQEVLRQIIRHERRVELAFEDLRMADLYRWGEWKNSIDRMNQDASMFKINYAGYDRNFRGNQDLVWPIPQSEIDTNKKLIQHDEWL